MPKGKWVDRHLEVAQPRRPLKLTGTRFAAVRGLNRWSSPFQAWCEVTRTYKPPFEDTIYTVAGRAIEPHQADWLQGTMGLGSSLLRPEDVYGGPDPARNAGWDFFPDDAIFGGMWDYLVVDEDRVPQTVIECKTTKRAEDWEDGVPEYYAEQAALYAALLHVDDVVMVCTFLKDEDYEHPADVAISSDNTITVEFSMAERYPDFEIWMGQVRDWWFEHVMAGKSPDYDERTDKEYLDALRTAIPSADTGIAGLVAEAEALGAELAPKEERLAGLKDAIKTALAESMGEGDTKAEYAGETLVWRLSRTESTRFDGTAFKKADPRTYQEFCKTSESIRLTTSNREDNQ